MGASTKDSSVEFCGGTHLGNTAEAEAFAILEETAVAKGIRRITAVTKDSAKQAAAEGKKIEALVQEAEKVSATDPDLDKQVQGIRKDLDEAVVSATLKTQLRDRIEKIRKKIGDVKRAAIAEQLDRCLDEVRNQTEAALQSGKGSMVLNVNIGADSKLSMKVVNAVQKLAPEMAFFGISEEEPGSGGKVLAFANVPAPLVEKGLKADAWVRAALETCGGRGGGKPNNAQGTAKECSDVNGIIDAANAFAKLTVS
eukprot:gnl/TRDRNA2_/TRDRNA2_172296_c2_seq3.p1 gnl/TRDRNA2_/TRDRNA2_172296_c2~~gnl/TRDRNA2_/TRDRNA2_172296_c2_seq3.p1  ORF type:complete len:255 (+),score=70.25 gnl/TRDRNA2_/TRDRNA2_172296_c2_seq3:3-767(+)